MKSASFLKRKCCIFKLTAWIILTVFSATGALFPSPSYAQAIFQLPTPGTMIPLTPVFEPPLVKGMTLYPQDPFKMDFIISPGEKNLKGDAFKAESEKLIKYFMAALTTPDEEMWVNLSPYEKDRIIADGLSQTAMGRDMLTQDYMLKQLTASLINPKEKLGEEFWRQVHEQTGLTEIPENNFNKIWIVPQNAKVTIIGDNVFVVDNHLKVMLEEDYLAINQNGGEKMKDGKNNPSSIINPQSSNTINNIFRQVILPKIEKEVNEGTTFANLRQMFNSMILATWYKKNLKESILTAQYANQNKINGINIEDKNVKERIYDQYVESFKKGVFDFIKEDYDPTTQTVVTRKYFSGGITSGPVSEAPATPPITGDENRVAINLKGTNSSWNPSIVEEEIDQLWKAMNTETKREKEELLQTIAEKSRILYKKTLSHELSQRYQSQQDKFNDQWHFIAATNIADDLDKTLSALGLSPEIIPQHKKRQIIFAIENAFQHAIRENSEAEIIILSSLDELEQNPSNPEIWVYVVDNGPGMPIKEVVEKGYRGEGSYLGMGVEITIDLDNEVIYRSGGLSFDVKENAIRKERPSETEIVYKSYPTPLKGTLVGIHITQEDYTRQKQVLEKEAQELESDTLRRYDKLESVLMSDIIIPFISQISTWLESEYTLKNYDELLLTDRTFNNLWNHNPSIEGLMVTANTFIQAFEEKVRNDVTALGKKINEDTFKIIISEARAKVQAYVETLKKERAKASRLEHTIIEKAEQTSSKSHTLSHITDAFSPIIEDISNQLNEVLKAQNKNRVQANPFGEGDDLVGALMQLGGTFTYPNGEMYLTEDGILVIIDDRFEGDHAGRGSYQLAAYARNKQKVDHELTELRSLIKQARDTGILKQEDVNSDYSNKIKAYTNDQNISDDELLRHRNEVIQTLNTAHTEGVKAEGDGRAVTQNELIPLLTLDESRALGLNFDFTIASTGGQATKKLSPEDRKARIADARVLLRELSTLKISIQDAEEDIRDYKRYYTSRLSAKTSSRNIRMNKHGSHGSIFAFFAKHNDGYYLQEKAKQDNVLSAALMLIQRHKDKAAQKVKAKKPTTLRSQNILRNAVVVFAILATFVGGYLKGIENNNETPQFKPTAPLIVKRAPDTLVSTSSTSSTTSTTIPIGELANLPKLTEKLWPDIPDIPELNEEYLRALTEGGYKVKFPNLRNYFPTIKNFTQLMIAKGSVESGLENNVESSAGAKGIWQMTKIAWKDVVRLNPELQPWADYDAYVNNPIANLYFSMTFFDYLLEKMEGEDYYPTLFEHIDSSILRKRIKAAIAAYNAGSSLTREELENAMNGGIAETTSHVEEVMRQFDAMQYIDYFIPRGSRLGATTLKIPMGVGEQKKTLTLYARLPKGKTFGQVVKEFSKVLGIRYSAALINNVLKQNPHITDLQAIRSNTLIDFTVPREEVIGALFSNLTEAIRSQTTAKNIEEKIDPKDNKPVTQKPIGSDISKEDLAKIIETTPTRNLINRELEALSSNLQDDYSTSKATYSAFKQAFPEFEKELAAVKQIIEGKTLSEALKGYKSLPSNFPITEVKITEAIQPMTLDNGLPIDAISYVQNGKLVIVIARGNEVGAFHEIYEQVILPLNSRIPTEAHHALATLAETGFSKSILSARAVQQLEDMTLEQLESFKDVDTYESVKEEIFSYNGKLGSTSKFGNYGIQSMFHIGYALKHAHALHEEAERIYQRKIAESQPLNFEPKAETPGGIDFNPTNMTLTVEGETLKARFKIDPAMLNGAPLDGLIPVIINITPLANIPLLLGLEKPPTKDNNPHQNPSIIDSQKALIKNESEA